MTAPTIPEIPKLPDAMERAAQVIRRGHEKGLPPLEDVCVYVKDGHLVAHFETLGSWAWALHLGIFRTEHTWGGERPNERFFSGLIDGVTFVFRYLPEVPNG